MASGAPPTSSLRPRGIPRRTLSRNVRPANYPRGVRSSPESCELRPPPARPFTGPAPSRRNRIFPGPCGSASREVLAPADTTTPGAPSPSRSSLRSPVRDEDRQTLVGAVLRVLAPLDGSGSSRLARGLLDPTDRRGPRRFAALFHAARVPGAPLQSFPFPGSRTRSRGPSAHLRVRSPTRRRRSACRIFTIAFARPRRLVAARAHPKVDPGLMRQDVGSSRSQSPVASKHRSAPHVPSASHQHWARR